MSSDTSNKLTTFGTLSLKINDFPTMWNTTLMKKKVWASYSMNGAAATTPMAQMHHEPWMWKLGAALITNTLNKDDKFATEGRLTVQGYEVCEQGFASLKTNTNSNLGTNSGFTLSSIPAILTFFSFY